MNNLTLLLEYIDANLALVPVNENKAPIIKNWQKTKSTREHIESCWANGHRNFGIVCGEMSGGLEVIDFDEKHKKGITKEWFNLLDNETKKEAQKLPLTATKNGGFHLLYRLEKVVDGNLKLAMFKGDTIIETRGVGGQVVEYPSDGYTIKRGSLTDIPIITQKLRDTFFTVARSMTDEDKEVSTPVPDSKGDRVGDVFNRTATWADILEKHGWVLTGVVGQEQRWTRPDKKIKDGISATVNHYGTDQLYVFSSNASPFEMNRGYTKFHAYTVLNHGGDFSASARDLRQSGKYEPTPPPTTTNTQEEDDDIITSRLDLVTMKKIDWLWEQKIPKGALSMISGEGGVGKSQLSMYMAACITNGEPFHEAGVFPVKKGSVGFITGEDSIETTIAPRAAASGADLSMIEIIETVKRDGKQDYIDITQDVEKIKKWILRRGDVQLLVIDPISAYLGSTDSHNNAEVRGALLGLSKLAEDHNIAIVMINHLNKSNGKTASSRIMGSQAFNNVVRASFAVIKDDEMRKFLPIKNNIGDDSTGLQYIIEGAVVGDNIATSKVVFMDGIITEDVNEEMNGDNKNSKVEEAKEYLERELADGEKSIKELIDNAPYGISKRTLYRAADDMVIHKTQQGRDNGSVWSMP